MKKNRSLNTTYGENKDGENKDEVSIVRFELFLADSSCSSTDSLNAKNYPIFQREKTK